MTYSLLLTSYALDQFGKLLTEDYVRVRDAITALAKEPRSVCNCVYGKKQKSLRDAKTLLE